jgi:hypothetical protein
VPCSRRLNPTSIKGLGAFRGTKNCMCVLLVEPSLALSVLC